jgi:D-alanyl-D-alanine carboxypeptidase
VTPVAGAGSAPIGTPGGGLAATSAATSVVMPSDAPVDAPQDDTAGDSSARDILLVNAANPLPEGYRPGTLVNLYAQKGRHFQLAKADIEVDETVFDAMEAMFTAAEQDGVDGFIITSGYRSREAQADIFASNTDGTAANPGESEHETGLAFDVVAMGDGNFENTPQFEWLRGHCAEYGFIIRYPKGKESVTGYPYEPWHYRYVGGEHAAAITDAGLTLEEYAGGFSE